MLLVGGVFGVWGLREAVVDQQAHAAEPTRLCVLGDLLDAEVTVLGGTLTCVTPQPSRAPVEDGPTRVEDEPARAADTPARADVVLPDADQPLLNDARTRDGVDAVVAAAASVVRPVVGLASPAVEEVAGTGVVEPVGTVVRPVAEPIVDVLPPVLTPVLAPVLDLAQPILGPPATPASPPTDPVEIAPAPAGDAPAAGAPGTGSHPAAPHLTVSPAGPAPASAAAAHQGATAEAGRTAQVPPRQHDASHPPGPASDAPASTAASSSAAVGTGEPADATARSWTPDLTRAGHHIRCCATLASRSPQPDTGPA
ncbi:hypothetical protein AB0873_11540 [Micromonospora sp. NPDC047707]|uniref:hypothetical protein n=1 Tax=Micromonospora sp. NPDC047707 TaxID=3154498 RepID=UPI003453B960